MRYSLFLIITFFLALNARASPAPIVLHGYIGVEGGELYSYKIVFTDSAGGVNGASYTYLKEPDATKSLITGSIDRVNKTLTIKEVSIVYNHGFHSTVSMCLVNVILRYLPDNTGSGHILKGNYSSADAGAAYCGMGTITFTNDEELRLLFETVATPLQAAPAKLAIAIPAPRRPAPGRIITEIIDTHAQGQETAVTEITTGIEKLYEWHSDTVAAELWDGGNIDGDNVSVYFNDKKVLDNYTLTAAKKLLLLPLSAGINTIAITANNEGSEPPNTANILLTDGPLHYNIIAYNNTGQVAAIKIRMRAK